MTCLHTKTYCYHENRELEWTYSVLIDSVGSSRGMYQKKHRTRQLAAAESSAGPGASVFRLIQLGWPLLCALDSFGRQAP